jgi:hypothetical protein
MYGWCSYSDSGGTVINFSFLSVVAITLLVPNAEPQSSVSLYARSNSFDFNDSPTAVIVRGSRWIDLFPNDGMRSRGPGAVVECHVANRTCVITQFQDRGSASTHTTYKVSRWDNDRIEAETSDPNIANTSVRDGHHQSVSTTCLILNRAKKQAFTVRKQRGQECSQLDKYIEGIPES